MGSRRRFTYISETQHIKEQKKENDNKRINKQRETSNRVKDSRIGFTGNVHLVPVHGKGVEEVFVEAHKLLGHVFFAVGRHLARGEASIDRLLNPQDVGQMVPSPGVRDGLVSAVLPQERAVFLQEAFKRRASGLRTHMLAD